MAPTAVSRTPRPHTSKVKTVEKTPPSRGIAKKTPKKHPVSARVRFAELLHTKEATSNSLAMETHFARPTAGRVGSSQRGLPKTKTSTSPTGSQAHSSRDSSKAATPGSASNSRPGSAKTSPRTKTTKAAEKKTHKGRVAKKPPKKLAEPPNNSSIKYPEKDRRKTLNGGHHCPECKRAFSNRCIAQNHKRECENHPGEFIFREHACPQCKAAGTRSDFQLEVDEVMELLDEVGLERLRGLRSTSRAVKEAKQKHKEEEKATKAAEKAHAPNKNKKQKR